MSRPRTAIPLALAALLPALALAQSPPPSTSAQGQAAPAAPPPCTAPEQRQFDFWLGQWEVTLPDGKPAGRSRIESILDGCVVLENWTGASGFSGKSFNIHNRATGNWEQYWVSHGGNRLHLVGGLRDGAMVLEGRRETPDPQSGKLPRERVTWTRQADGAVRQLWETSTDDGASWQVTFDGLYRHSATASAAEAPAQG